MRSRNATSLLCSTPNCGFFCSWSSSTTRRTFSRCWSKTGPDFSRSALCLVTRSSSTSTTRPLRRSPSARWSPERPCWPSETFVWWDLKCHCEIQLFGCSAFIFSTVNLVYLALASFYSFCSLWHGNWLHLRMGSSKRKGVASTLFSFHSFCTPSVSACIVPSCSQASVMLHLCIGPILGHSAEKLIAEIPSFRPSFNQRPLMYEVCALLLCHSCM